MAKIANVTIIPANGGFIIQESHYNEDDQMMLYDEKQTVVTSGAKVIKHLKGLFVEPRKPRAKKENA